MSRSSSNDLRELTRRVEADHRAMARACERVWLEELERRRRQLAIECDKLLNRV
jgi:hypothetical protein